MFGSASSSKERGNMLKRLFMLGTLAAFAAVPSAAWADWHEPVGGASPINSSPTRNSSAANLGVISGTPYVAWNEDTTQQGQGIRRVYSKISETIV